MFECHGCGADLGFNQTNVPVGFRCRCPTCGARYLVVADGEFKLTLGERDKGYVAE